MSRLLKNLLQLMFHYPVIYVHSFLRPLGAPGKSPGSGRTLFTGSENCIRYRMSLFGYFTAHEDYNKMDKTVKTVVVALYSVGQGRM